MKNHTCHDLTRRTPACRLSVMFATAFALIFTGLATDLSAVAGKKSEHFIGTWSSALHQPSPGPPGLTNSGFNNQTLRQIVHTSVGGDAVRVRLSTFGAHALDIGSAHIALRDAGVAIVPGSDRMLTFGGEPSFTIPAGAVVLSDPVDLEVPALSDLAVSIFVPGSTGSATWHFEALQTSYISPSGDFTGSLEMPVAATSQAWFWLAGVDVQASKQTGAIAIFGDSITDGARSTPNTNNRWPDHLARRLMARHGTLNFAVLNAAISGNRLLHDGIGSNGLARFDGDVLMQPGVTHVIVLLGNNDFLFVFNPAEDVSADQIIQGHRQLIRRAHDRGLKIYGATLTPFGGFFFSSPEKEAKRQAVNTWIRTCGEYDAVIDFDELVRDPDSPTRLLPLYDSGDHLHPNDLGYEALGNAIDLKLFKKGENY